MREIWQWTSPGDRRFLGLMLKTNGVSVGAHASRKIYPGWTEVQLDLLVLMVRFAWKRPNDGRCNCGHDGLEPDWHSHSCPKPGRRRGR